MRASDLQFRVVSLGLGTVGASQGLNMHAQKGKGLGFSGLGLRDRV